MLYGIALNKHMIGINLENFDGRSVGQGLPEIND